MLSDEDRKAHRGKKSKATTISSAFGFNSKTIPPIISNAITLLREDPARFRRIHRRLPWWWWSYRKIWKLGDHVGGNLICKGGQKGAVVVVGGGGRSVYGGCSRLLKPGKEKGVGLSRTREKLCF